MPAARDPLDDDVHRMVHGDDESFRVVFRAVQPRLQRYLVVMVGQVDAEDVASETWAQACRDLSTFSGGADAFRAWITVIGRHRALDHLRAASRRPVVDEPLENLTESAAADDVEDVVQERDSTQRALQLIATLPREQAEAVLLRAVMGLDAKASGAVLGRSAGAVRTAAYRGLRTLAKRLPSPSSDIFGDPDADEVR